MPPAEITDAVEQTSRLVSENYVFPELGATLGEMLTERMAQGRYAAAGEPAALATLVTEDLQSINGDRHLRLKHHVDAITALPDDAGLIEALTRQADRAMGGVGRVERLASNIGYLDLSPLLFPPSLAGEAVIAAMQLVAGADALIIDLRGTVGGDPTTVALVCSYLFDGPTHLNTVYLRDGDRTIQSWTLPYVPGSRFGGAKPIWVLTSSSTFSGGEELPYDLQQHGRATIIGERTGGGAHLRTGFRIHPHLEVTVPTGRPTHPVSGTNWEGSGVLPDIEVPAADAFDTARRQAARTPTSELDPPTSG